MTNETQHALYVVLRDLHERLMECSNHPIDAAEAYDSFYQQQTIDALLDAQWSCDMTNETKTPDHLPPVPDGYVYAGKGGGLPGDQNDGTWKCWQGAAMGWTGTVCHGYCAPCADYAVPDTSDLGRKILAERGKPSWGESPEDATHLASNGDGQWVWFIDCVRDPEANDHGGWNFSMCGSSARVEFSNNAITTNPNWRETLERRPEAELRSVNDGMNEALSKLTVKVNLQEVCETVKKAIREAKESGELPDLIIPAKIAETLSDEATGSIIYAARENGYRIDIDDDGIRGWKGD